MRIISFIAICFLYCSCTLGQQKRHTHFFIPKDYTGWVNIVFDDSSSTKEVLSFSDGFVFMINKSPEEFRIRSKAIPDGRYIDHFYYYNLDTVIRLKDLDYPKSNIFFGRFIIKHEKDKKGSFNNKQIYSFYVSKELLDTDGLSIDKLPKNKLAE
jgi:hypothetical protein